MGRRGIAADEAVAEVMVHSSSRRHQVGGPDRRTTGGRTNRRRGSPKPWSSHCPSPTSQALPTKTFEIPPGVKP